MFTSKPPFDYDKIPAELKVCCQWVCWELRPRGPKMTKVPIDPKTGIMASSANPDTWATYEQATGYLESMSLSGVGFVFTTSDPFTGIDLDHCRDAETGIIEPWAWRIICQLRSYAEASPSGEGVHVIVKGTVPRGREKTGFGGIHSDRKYFTCTGQRVPGVPTAIADRQDELMRIYTAEFGDGNEDEGSSLTGALIIDAYREPPVDKLEVLLQNEKVREAWDHERDDLTDFSASAYDMALANAAARAGWEPQEIADLLVRHRERFGEAPKHFSYYRLTVLKAFQGLRDASPAEIAQAHTDNRMLRREILL